MYRRLEMVKCAGGGGGYQLNKTTFTNFTDKYILSN